MTDSILLTSAGRRTSLLSAFKEAANKCGWRVIAGDRDGLAPALYFAHQAIQLPAIQEHDYIERLLQVAMAESVRLIVPTIDTELEILALHAGKFQEHHCTVLISSPEFVAMTGDKWLTAECFRAESIAVPRSWLPEEIDKADLPFDLFIKPRAGSASQNVFSITRESLARVIESVHNPIIQERLSGPEITVDALLDLEGTPVHFVPRRRIRTLGGESIQGVTLDDSELRDWIIRILQVATKHGARGPLTLQAFLTERGPVLTEINPRFGGGFPLTRAAGGNYPDWILQELNGRKPQPCFGKFTKNLHMTRYYVEHFVEQPLWE